jgi:putative heme iron utilization protein
MSDTPAERAITPRPETLPEPDDFDAPALARRLLRSARTASLATLDPAGHPFVTLTNLATDFDGAPLFIASRLALHCRNMLADGRVSLLLAPGGKGDPLAHPRLTLSGRAAPDPAPHLRRRFLARHPKAALYAELPDFAIWRVELQAAHLIGGFGRAPELTPADILLDLSGAGPLLEAEADAVAHMNADHAEAIALYATRFGRAEAGPWRLSGLDPEGMDLVLEGSQLRLCFPERVVDGAALRRVLVGMAAEARRDT